jgi:2-oxoisovalerate dehydrogenase E2 component (dihydrolipoyl transacylase)
VTERAESPSASDQEVRAFLVPDLGEGLVDATVVGWMVAPGDVVELNQVLCELETAKAVVEIPSPWPGTIVELGGDAGTTLDVGAMLVRIALSESPPPRQPTLVGYGPAPSIGGRRRRASHPVRTEPPASTPLAAPSTPLAAPSKPLAAPPVRKLALDLGVDLSALAPGSGPDGLITRGDVRRAAAGVVATAPGSAPDRGSAPTDETVPVVGIRARIAQNVATSRATIPDATCSVVVDCRRLLQLRDTLRTALERRGDPTVVTPFALVCRMLVDALGTNPELNATWVDDGPAIRLHRHLHLGIGTATERGLLVPVVRDADRLSTRELAAAITRLAEGARTGRLSPAELTGSTFTVSNFGALGLDEGIPVINHPEAGILGVGAIKERPHVVDGAVVACPTTTLTLAFDHRVADGAEAGRLLSTLRDLIEAPEIALLDR